MVGGGTESQAEAMSTGTKERSYLGVLRAFLPKASVALPAGVDTRQVATSPGQNQFEVYGLAAYAFLFVTCWLVEMVGSFWLGLPLSFLVIHVVAVAGALLGSRLPTMSGQASVWPQRLQWFFLGALAWIAITKPLVMTQWLAWPLMLLLISQLFLWPGEPSRLGAVLFWLAQLLAVLLCLSLPWDWRVGVAAIFLMHLVLLYGALHPRSEIFGPVLQTFLTKEKVVWLTIDDGPSEDTLAMLDLLDEFDAKATFFVIGSKAEAAPELVRAMAERGHEIGNHTYRHPASTFWILPGSMIFSEIQRTQDVVTRIMGKAPQRFRSPVGFASPMLYPVLQRLGLPAIGWSARGFDGRGTEVEPALAKLTQGLQSGDIILLHEGRAHNVPLLRALLQHLRSEGFRCVDPNLVENGTAGLS